LSNISRVFARQFYWRLETSAILGIRSSRTYPSAGPEAFAGRPPKAFCRGRKIHFRLPFWYKL